MREIMEHYGVALLAILEVVGALSIVYECMEPGGIFFDLTVSYMNRICG